MKSLRRFEAPWALISGFAFFLAWQVAVEAFEVPAYLLPTPTAIVLDMVKHWRLLSEHALITLWEIGLGFVVSILIAMPLAVMFTYSRIFEKLFYPLIVGTQTIPKVAVAPLFLVWFGFGLTPKVIIVTLMTFFPIVINAVVGLKSLNFQTVYLAQSMGAGPWQVFWHFRLPNALPSIFAGLKVACVLAVIGAIVAEFAAGTAGSGSGLAYRILEAGYRLNIPRMFAALILISLTGIAIFLACTLLQHLLLRRWHESAIKREV